MVTISVNQMKTLLPQLLERVAQGEEITITRRGIPIAKLTPPSKSRQEDVKKVIEEMRKLRKGITLGGLKIKDLIQEGRVG